ncbi:MAG: hypothetical protein ACO1Q7_19160, partial [Gemmatimonas sp.]
AELMDRRDGGSHAPDAWMRLTIDERSVDVAICARRRITDQVIARAHELAGHWFVALVVVPHIRPEIQQRLKLLGINFADLTGTISLQAPGVRLDVRGTLPVPDTARSSVKQQINPFSKKASAVLRVLCEEFPRGLSLTSLAEKTALSRGWISSVVRELIERDYAADEGCGVMLSNPVDMLRDWITEYRWSRNVARHYVLPFEGAELLQQLRQTLDHQQIRWALTLVSGAHLRVEGLSQNSTHHVYIEASESALKNALDAMFAQPVLEGGNLILFAPPYYGPSVFIGTQEARGVKVVSDVQLLLDLARYPLRGPELAQSLIRSHLVRQFELTESEAHRLSERIA